MVELKSANCSFSISYANGSLKCKFRLNAAILDFSRIEVGKHPIFHKSSRRPQMVRFVLVTGESSLTWKFELNTVILDFGRFQVTKNPIFHNSSRRPEMVRFVLVALRKA